jgi:small subunit ribosomal protein S13
MASAQSSANAVASRFMLNRSFDANRIFSFSLRKVYGINHTRANLLCDKFGISRTAKMEHIPEHKLSQVEDYVKKNFTINRELKREIAVNIQNKIQAGTWEGLRLEYGLPAHGQRTHSNASTAEKLKDKYGA